MKKMQATNYLDELLLSAKIELMHVNECKPPAPPARPVIVVHAGAEDTCAVDRLRELSAVKSAARSAYKLLTKPNVDAVDAVEHALKRMETFYLRQLEKEGITTIEADAIIVDDNNIKSGSVGAVKDYRHPISLAKYILRKTDCCFVAGEGVGKLIERLGSEVNRDCIEDESISTEEQEEDRMTARIRQIRLEEKKYTEELSQVNSQAETDKPKTNKPTYKIKVFGAAAFDSQRQLACGTTVFRCMPVNFGRLSATGSVVGCGVACDEHGCACLCGDDDSSIYLRAPASDIVDSLQEDQPKTAMCRELQQLGCRSSAAIAIDRSGSPYIQSRCESFPYAYCIGGKLFYGCWRDEMLCDEICKSPRRASSAE